MTNKSLILNLYNQTINYLDLTFLDSNLIELVKTKDDFKNIITNLLTFVVDCEDQDFVDQKNQQRLLAAFSAITGNEFVANTMMTYKTDEELDADVKSFDSYLVKNLDKNFEQIKAEFKSKHVEEQPVKVESEVVGVATASTVNNTNENAHNEHEEFDAEKFFENNKTNLNDLAETMITSSANSILLMNIRKGSVYQYKTKPKIVPIIKWVIIAIISVIIALSIASFTVKTIAFSTPDKFLWTPKKPEGATETTRAALGGFSLPFGLILEILIFAMMISSMIRNNKNENFKYYLSWGWMLIYTLTLMFVWFLTDSGIMFKYNQWIDYLGIDRAQSKLGLQLLDSYRIIQFTILGCLGIIIIMLIVGCLFNPKKDIERLKQLLDQYTDEIKSGTMPLDGSASDFGRFFGTWF